ncbi:MAG: DUF1192 domain-containing protein [Alphaproteobacteria bacterium]|nr:DUF1192 domain-containing protein [Alphaproteobacteria bacterium]
MFDDDLPQKKTSSEFPRNLETMSVSELQDYIGELEAEIARAKSDIDKKQASQAAASSFFKD